jgi:hypothetical protein
MLGREWMEDVVERTWMILVAQGAKGTLGALS